MNENENNMNNKEKLLREIKVHVLDEINAGKINMRSRLNFLTKLVSLIVVAVLTLLLSSFLVSFIFFSIVESGRLFLLGFGLRGFLIFASIFPWTLIGIEIIFIILLQWLIKKFKFGYRNSILVLILIILCISVVISLIIDDTPFHAILLRQAEHKELPVFGDMYRGIHRPPPRAGLFRGTIFSVGTSSFSFVQTIDADDGVGSTTNVILPVAYDIGDLSDGDTVLIVGEQLPGFSIRAFGVKKISTTGTE